MITPNYEMPTTTRDAIAEKLDLGTCESPVFVSNTGREMHCKSIKFVKDLGEVNTFDELDHHSIIEDACRELKEDGNTYLWTAFGVVVDTNPAEQICSETFQLKSRPEGEKSSFVAHYTIRVA